MFHLLGCHLIESSYKIVMDRLPAFGKSIQDVVVPTFQTYAPLLQQNASTIRSVKKETFQYGPHERQQLDIYTPPTPAIINGRKPVLMFEYGGGLVNGARTLPIADELAHANVGAFFALRFGYTVVIADYRLMSHGAKFPSGGEDIALAIQWLCEHPIGPGTMPIDLFLMGNSAGGIHLTTFLLHQDFAEARTRITTGSGLRLRGVVLVGVPFDFHQALPSRIETLTAYFGDHNVNGPLGLLKSARQRGAPFDFVQSGVRILALDAELDPEDEVLDPRDRFVREWMEMTDTASRCALAVDMMKGHNHISPPFALGTGLEREEAWGYQVAGFCDNIRKFAPRP